MNILQFEQKRKTIALEGKYPRKVISKSTNMLNTSNNSM